MCQIHYEQYSGGTWSVCMRATNQCSRVTCWWRRQFHGPLSPSLFRFGQMRPADPTGGFMKSFLRNFLLGRRKNMAQRHIPTMTNSHHGWNLSAIRLLVLEVMLWTGRQWRLSRCRLSTLLLSSSLGHPTQLWEPGQCHKNKSIDLKKSSLNFVLSGTPSTGFSS